MYHARRNVSRGIGDFRKALFNSFNGEGDCTGDTGDASDEDLGEVMAVSVLLFLFSLDVCAAIALRRVNELPTPLVARLNHADGGGVGFKGLIVLSTDVPGLLLREPVSPPPPRTLMSIESSENLDIKLSALAEGRRSIRGSQADQVGQLSMSTGCTNGDIDVGERIEKVDMGENAADGSSCVGGGRLKSGLSAAVRRGGGKNGVVTRGARQGFSGFLNLRGATNSCLTSSSTAAESSLVPCCSKLDERGHVGGDGAARPGISQVGVSPNLRTRSLSNGGTFASGMHPNSDCADGRRLRTIAKTSSMARSHRASSYPPSGCEYSSQIPIPASKLQLPKRRGMILNSSSSLGSSSSPGPSTSSESREELDE
jgi:hypothetical protein